MYHDQFNDPGKGKKGLIIGASCIQMGKETLAVIPKYTPHVALQRSQGKQECPHYGAVRCCLKTGEQWGYHWCPGNSLATQG